VLLPSLDSHRDISMKKLLSIISSTLYWASGELINFAFRGECLVDPLPHPVLSSWTVQNFDCQVQWSFPLHFYQLPVMWHSLEMQVCGVLNFTYSFFVTFSNKRIAWHITQIIPRTSEVDSNLDCVCFRYLKDLSASCQLVFWVSVKL